MADTVHFAVVDEFENWLDGKPKEWAQALAMRSALRVLPYSQRVYSRNPLPLLSHEKSLIKAVLRANLVTWACNKYPTKPGGFVARNAFAAASIAATKNATLMSVSLVSAYIENPGKTLNNVSDLDDFSYTAVASAKAAMSIFGLEDIPKYAVEAVNAAAKSAQDQSQVWETLSFDANLLVKHSELAVIAQAARKLITAPLWIDQYGKRQELAFHDALYVKYCSLPIQNHQIWQIWYDNILKGNTPFGLGNQAGEKLALKIATQDEEFWEQDLEDVNGEILGWYEEERGKVSDNKSTHDFFISYATQDEKMAKEINAIVEALGHTTFAQFKDFGPGTNFIREMQRGLANTSRLIALYSPAYEESDHCQAEWAAAYNQDPGSENGKLLPFLIETTALNPLASQVVYRSLVGKNKTVRKAEIIDALNWQPTVRDAKELRSKLASLASPDATLDQTGKLDAGPNRETDVPFVTDSLAELPSRQRAIINTILNSLGPQAPIVLKNVLEAYSKHLLTHGPQPSVGTLDDFNDSVRATLSASDMNEWGAGLESLFKSFAKNHSNLMTHFPLRQERETIYSQHPIDEDQANGDKLFAPVIAVNKAIEDVTSINKTTDEFVLITDDQAQRLKDISLLPPMREEDRIAPLITIKRRTILSQIGFYERVLAAVGASATLAATPQGAALIAAVKRAIDALMAFVL